MREYLFDAGLIVFGTAVTAGSWWLLIHLSDRRVLRRFRPKWNPLQGKLTHDETVAQRSLFVAFCAIILMLMGTVSLMAGILRAFGIGR
jgi:hypothetical protein